MRKLIILFLLMLPMLLQAQEDLSKYMAGAVPEENGKVVFTTQLAVEGQNKEGMMQHMKTWAESVCKRKEVIDNKSRIVYANEEKGEILVTAEEYMVFSNSGLSLDRTRIYYNLRINCEDGLCIIKMQNIRYLYDENRDGGTRYTAEEAISDKECLYKNNTKMYKSIAKFRIHTIDLKDLLFSDASKAFGYQEQTTAKLVTATPAVQPAAKPVETVTATPVQAAPVKQEAKQTVVQSVKKQEEPIKQTHIAAEPAQIEHKDKVTFTVQTDSPLYQLLEQTGKATLTIISENGTTQVLQFHKAHTEKSADNKTCTITGELSK